MAKQRFEDLGIGSKAAESRLRLLNRDGTFNIRRTGQPFLQWFSIYHFLISISWWKFNFLILLAYVAINAVFGGIYLLTGTGGLAGIDGHTLAERYIESVFFSTQTFTTVGFGRIAPVGMAANIISSFESVFGLLCFALATGLLYGRFSRPVAKIIFSHNALVAPYQNITAFMFRSSNQRANQLIDVSATVTLSRYERLPNGERIRKFYTLDLERHSVALFYLSWTVVHPITEESPLFGVTKEQLDESDAEFLVLLKAFDDSFSQYVHARTSYKNSEVLFGHKFKSIIRVAPDGMTELDLSNIHEYEKADVVEGK